LERVKPKRFVQRAEDDAFLRFSTAGLPQRSWGEKGEYHEMRERKPIDAALRSYLDGLAPPAGAPATGAERVVMGRARMMKALKSRASIPGLPNGVTSLDISLTDKLSGRLYVPVQAGGPAPVLVYFHGGGWVFGSIETHDPFCQLLSEAAGIFILSVDYPLAPEHPFPAGLEDSVAALRWAAGHLGKWGCDVTRLAIGGDSAGANLAAAAANRLCARPDSPALRAQLLLFPVTDHPSGKHPSYTENATGYGLDANLMNWLWQQYAPGVSPDEPDVSLLRLKQVPALPPAFVATAEYDPLRDEGIAYAEKLRAAGIKVTHFHAPDMHHNFLVHPGTVARFPQCHAALADVASWLKTALA
jgi:acetyl esterase